MRVKTLEITGLAAAWQAAEVEWHGDIEPLFIDGTG